MGSSASWLSPTFRCLCSTSPDEESSPASQSVVLHTLSSLASTHLQLVLHLPHSRRQLLRRRQYQSVASFSLSRRCCPEYSCWARSGSFGDTSRSGLLVNVLPASASNIFSWMKQLCAILETVLYCSWCN